MATAALGAIGRHPRHVLLFAVAAGLLLGPLSPLATLLAAAVAAAISLRGASAVALAAAAAAAVLLGAVVADLRLAALEGGLLPGMHGRSIAARAVVLEPVRERAGGPAVARARLLDGPAAGEGAVLRMRTAAHAGAWPGVGRDRRGWRARSRRSGRSTPTSAAAARPPRSRSPRLRATGERRGGPAGIVDAARRRAETGLGRGLAEPEAALLRGMVLGQDEQLTAEVRDDFKRSGLAHILAVSGQNVMLLATLVLTAGAVAGLALRVRLVLALALVALYVPLTGAGPSIQRAGVMGAAGLVAALAGRPSHRWYALGLAAAVTLALNPRVAGEPGWQLSFAAVVALLALAPAAARRAGARRSRGRWPTSPRSPSPPRSAPRR